MPAIYQSLASIARMPPPGVTPRISTASRTSSSSTTTTTTTTTVTETVPPANKPKLTLSVLTDYLTQLETTPITSNNNLEEPSSTTAECGEGLGADAGALSAAARADEIFKKWVAAGMPEDGIIEEETEPKKDSIEEKDEEEDSTDVDTPKGDGKKLELPNSSSEDDTQARASSSAPKNAEQDLTNKLLHERVSKFLETIGQPPTRSERNERMAKENRSLQKQLASLQRAGQVLMKEKQNLVTQVAALKQKDKETHHAMYQQKNGYEAKLKEMKEQLAAQKEEFEKQMAQQKEEFEKQLVQQKDAHEKELIQQKENFTLIGQRRSSSPTPSVQTLKPTAPKLTPTPTPTPTDIASWFTTRRSSWQSWATTHAHPSPNRLVELHPIQRDELCRGISHFVHLTADNKLPDQLMAYTTDEKNCNEHIRALLYGMLSNFIIGECFSSPWWIFKALSSKTNPEMESPTYERVTGAGGKGGDVEAAGFGVDMASWQSPEILSPVIAAELEVPATARSMSFLSPRLTNPGQMSMQSLSVITAVATGLGEEGREKVEVGRLPGGEEMEGLFELLGKVQTKPTASSSLRAQLLHLLREGGLALDATHPDIANHADRRMLAEARKDYARKLKDKFLSGPARFLLRDQTPEGISILESKLVGEIDLSLRFSVLVWGREDGDIKFSGLKELSEYYDQSEMEVYGGGKGKKEDGAERPSSAEGEKPPPAEVTMVLQPTISCTIFSSASMSGRSSPDSQPQPQTTTISKAVVLLSNVFPPPPSMSTTSHAPAPSCSRPSTPQNASISPQETSFRLSMTACPGTPANLSEEGLEHQEISPAASGKPTRSSLKLKLRSSPELKLGGSGWVKDAVADS